MKIELKRVCSAFPEAYEAYVDKKEVAYIRLRWGFFSIYCGPKRIFIEQLKDMQGIFFTQEERNAYLSKAKKEITKYLNETFKSAE